MGHPFRWLPYLLRFQSSVGPQEITGEDAACTSPVVFPDDKDEPIEIVFSCSHNEFTQMLSSLIIGGQIAYPETFVNIMNMFLRNWECDMDICERVAACLTENNETLINALADALTGNPTLLQALVTATSENGAGTPGQPLSEEQQQRDLLPPGVKPDDECDYDALWGACLYLVQSGNRAITDFFENLEAASNTLEAATIIAGAIPAAGQYAQAAGNFADQMQENIAEGYAAAYTETYEEELACALFCLARSNDCELPLDGMVAILSDRLSVPGTVVDFGLLMTFVSSGTWIGGDIANIAYLVYFNALKYGQQFGDIIGVRPLSDLMGLGADQLASDNWITLCDCPDTWSKEWDFAIDPYEWNIVSGEGVWESGVGFRSDPGGTDPYAVYINVGITVPSGSEITAWRIEAYSETADDTADRAIYWMPGSVRQEMNESQSGEWNLTGVPPFGDPDEVVFGVTNFTIPGENIIRKIRLSGTGVEPTWA